MDYKKEAIQILDIVLSSKKNKLSKKDREALIILREKIKSENKRKGLLGLLKELAKIAGIGLQHFTGT